MRAAMLRPAFDTQYSARDGDEACAETEPMKMRRGLQPGTACRRSSMYRAARCARKKAPRRFVPITRS